MFPQLSIAHLSALEASPPNLLGIAADCGFDFIGLRLAAVTSAETCWPLIDDPALRRETLARMALTGVRVLDVELVRLTPDFVATEWEPFLETAAMLGARHVLTQAHDSEFRRVAQNYAEFCDLAAGHGLTSDIEFLPWTSMRDLASAVALVEAADRVNAGICIDTLHFDRAGCHVDEIDALSASWLHYAQIADAPALAPTSDAGLIRTARQARLLPGEGGIDLEGILSRLPSGLPLALEIPNLALAELLPNGARLMLAKEALLGILRKISGGQSPCPNHSTATLLA